MPCRGRCFLFDASQLKVRPMTNAAPFDLFGKRVWVAGHTGLVGRAVASRLADNGAQVLTVVHRDSISGGKRQPKPG